MLALRAARLFDGQSGDLVERPLVLIDGGRVSAVERGAVEPPAGAEVVDLGEVTLMPGLVDTHVHLAFDASADPVARMRADDDAALLLRMRLAARQHLVAGVTTVRDLGDRGYLAVSLRDWFREGHELGPEILASGPPLTVTGGHCHFMGGQADDEAELRRGVRIRCTRGVDVIKVMVTGGNMTAGIDPLTPQYSQAELAAVVEESHRFGRAVTAHVHGADGIAMAVEAGVDGLEHCGFWVAGGVRADPAVIERIAERGITVCPTLGLLPGSPPPPPAVASRIPAMTALFGRMHQAGVRLVGGTDAGIAPAKPHGIAPYVVDHLVIAGLSALDALRALTSAGAAACDLTGRKGVLVAGADADIISVPGDPLREPATLRQVTSVFRGGLRVPMDEPAPAISLTR